MMLNGAMSLFLAMQDAVAGTESMTSTGPSVPPAKAPVAPREGADFFLPPDYATFGGNVDTPFWFITWICIFFFVLIVVLMVYFMFKYNRSLGAKQQPDATTHHTALEVTWSGIPLILVIAMFYFGFEGYMDMITPPKDAYTINVTAQKWSWAFEYPNGEVSPELHVWASEDGSGAFQFRMKSQDVLHAFFIPDFRVKSDIVPGKYSTVWFVPRYSGKVTAAEKEGMEYPEAEAHHLFCAEYCGTQHSDMHAWVYVHPNRASFDAWMAEVRDTANWPLEALGEKVYRTRGCAGCHTLDGSMLIGPSFKNAWNQIADGTRAFSSGDPIDTSDPMYIENYIMDSIRRPLNRIVEGYPNSMPVTNLKDREIDGIVAFLKWLSENDGPPWPIDQFKAEQKLQAANQ